MYTGTQHAFISEKVAIDAAKIWLDIIEDQFGLDADVDMSRQQPS